MSPDWSRRPGHRRRSSSARTLGTIRAILPYFAERAARRGAPPASGLLGARTWSPEAPSTAGCNTGRDAARYWLNSSCDWQTGYWQTGLATDSEGRDLLARIVWGSRISIQVALAATLCSLLIGVTYGALSAGYLGGRVDNLMMRIVDVLYSIPFIFVVIFLITIINEYRSELAEVYGIDRTIHGLLRGDRRHLLADHGARRSRPGALPQEHRVHRGRARARRLDPRILFAPRSQRAVDRDRLPDPDDPGVMLFEAFLSFLGLGVEPPKVSWGLLAVDGTEAINPMRTFWWLVAWPGRRHGLDAAGPEHTGRRSARRPRPEAARQGTREPAASTVCR